MPGMTPEQHLDHVRELAELKTQVTNVAEDVGAIVRQMDRVWELQNQMARMQQEQADHKDSIRRSFERIEAAETSGAKVKETTERWVNRGVGAWAVGVLLFGVIQFLVVDRVRNYETTQRAMLDQLVTIDRRLAWLEYDSKKDRKPDELPTMRK